MRIAVFASGSGSNFQSIIDAAASGALKADLALCVSNRETCGAFDRARTAGIPTLHLDPRDFAEESEYVAALLDGLKQHDVDFIALAGYLRKIPSDVVRAFRGRITNIHPALLPAHGGPGMYGMHVHRAVLASGDSHSGATVHFVDEDYDTGPIILQDTVPVMPGDSAEELAARVLRAEHRLYPAALEAVASGRTRLDGSTVHLTLDAPNPPPVPSPK